jgi:hypothetical protein
MYYVSTVSYNTTDENGKDKNVKEKIILENCETFTEAEKRSYNEYQGSKNFDVTDIKRYPKLREFVNNNGDGEKIFIADLISIFITESGKEKQTHYHVGIFADNKNEADKLLNEYLRQGFDDIIPVGIKETRFVNLLYA